MSILGIYGRPFITMDHLLDIPGLLAIHDDIVDGLCLSQRSFGVYGSGILDKKKYLDNTEAAKQILKLPDDDKLKQRYLRLQTRDDRNTFLKLACKTYVGHRTVFVRSSKSYKDWGNAANNQDSADAKNFPTLMTWLYKQSVFSSIGRINFFITDHDLHTVEHRDHGSEAYANNYEMLWIRTALDKGLYILDPDTKERHYLKGYTCFFNQKDIHGGDPSPHMTFSFRVDGVFTPETRKAIGVPENPMYGE